MSETSPAIIEFMQNRRSVPAKMMAGPGPDRDEIAAMIAIAARVPDHGKLHPWRFVLFGEKACARINKAVSARAAVKYPDMNADMKEVEASRFSRAPVVIAIVMHPVQSEKAPQWEQILSTGAAAMNLLIAANAFGFDANWITEWVAYDDELRSAFDLQEGEKIAGFMHIGTRTSPKTERDRPQMHEIYSIIEE